MSKQKEIKNGAGAATINYAELVEFIGENFDRANRDIKGLRKLFTKLQSSVEGIASQMKSDSQEIIMMISQIKRHDGWIHTIADANKLKLSP